MTKKKVDSIIERVILNDTFIFWKEDMGTDAKTDATKASIEGWHLIIQKPGLLGRKKITNIALKSLWTMFSKEDKWETVLTLINSVPDDERLAFVKDMLTKMWILWEVVRDCLNSSKGLEQLFYKRYKEQYEESNDFNLVRELIEISNEENKQTLFETLWYWADEQQKQELMKKYFSDHQEVLMQYFDEAFQQFSEKTQQNILTKRYQWLSEKDKKRFLSNIYIPQEIIKEQVKAMENTDENIAFLREKLKEMEEKRDDRLKTEEDKIKEKYQRSIAPVAERIRKVIRNPILLQMEYENEEGKHTLSEKGRDKDKIFETIDFQKDENLGKEYFITEEKIKRYHLTPCDGDQSKTRIFLENNGEIYEEIWGSKDQEHYKTTYQELRNSKWEKYALLDNRFIFKEPPEGTPFKVIGKDIEKYEEKTRRDYTCIISDKSFVVHCTYKKSK